MSKVFRKIPLSFMKCLNHKKPQSRLLISICDTFSCGLAAKTSGVRKAVCALAKYRVRPTKL